jgi:hypothetical protein
MPHDNDEKVKAGGCCVGYACCWLLLGFLFAFFCSLLLLASSFLILTNCKTTTTPLLFMIIQSLHAGMSCIFLDFIDCSSKVYGYVQRYVVCRDEDSNIRPHPPHTCVCAKSRVFFVFWFSKQASVAAASRWGGVASIMMMIRVCKSCGGIPYSSF